MKQSNLIKQVFLCLILLLQFKKIHDFIIYVIELVRVLLRNKANANKVDKDGAR